MSSSLDANRGASANAATSGAVPFPETEDMLNVEFLCDEMPGTAGLFSTLRAIRLADYPAEAALATAELAVVLARNRTVVHRIPLGRAQREAQGWLLSQPDLSGLSAAETTDDSTAWRLYLVTKASPSEVAIHRMCPLGEVKSFTLAFCDASGAPRHLWSNGQKAFIGHPRWHVPRSLSGLASRIRISRENVFSARFRFPRPPEGLAYAEFAFVGHPAGADLPVIRKVEVAPRAAGRFVVIDVTMPLATLTPGATDGVRIIWQPYALLPLPSGETLFVGAPTTAVERLPLGRYLRLMVPRPSGQIAPELVVRFHLRLHSWGLFTMAKPPSQGSALLLDALAAVCYCFLAPILRFRHIWLFYEKFFSARENAMVFFRYCVQQQVDKKHRICLRYVCAKDSPEYAAHLADVDQGRVVEPGSLRHRVLLLGSRLLLSTETKLLAMGINRMHSPFNLWVRRFKPLWFLEHGIKAFKFPNSYSQASLTYVTTCNEFEQDWMRKLGGWPPEDIVLTGLARWDNLVNRAPDRARPLVLVMPTFRLWLNDVPDDVFSGSEFFVRWRDFLTSPRLHQWLRERNVDLVFHTHPLMDSRLSAFVRDLPPSIRILSGDDPPLFSLIQEASLFVTDFSSIVFHGLFLGKPAIFYPFDRERFAASSHPLVNLETDLPGPGPDTLDALLDEMEAAAARHWTLRQEDIPRRDRYFSFRDHDNCKRTLEAILAKKL